MTRTSHPTVAYEPADPIRSAVAVVTCHLDELGVGEHWVQTREQDGRPVIDRKIPPGLGWCRAVGLYPALWPATADLAVQVEWHPDHDIPATEQAEHWQTRLAAVTSGLESLGYTVRVPGPRRRPGVDRDQPLVVSRLAAGGSLAPCPVDGWEHLADGYPTYASFRDDPSYRLRHLIEDSCLTGYGFRTLDLHLWPPYATAAWVVMRTSSGRNDSADDWHSAMTRLRRVLRASGYGLLDHGRPWDPAVDHTPYLIAYLRDGTP
ncbi:hypothetical protein [Streptomyces sp. NPDC088847]|uniref:hypothetical protein n=1 Tax=Streptomyces sp. NPDC088847 TaxID=3365909 RepID=UPI00380CB8CB